MLSKKSTLFILTILTTYTYARVEELKTPGDVERVLHKKTTGKPTIVKLYAHWCGPCKHIAPWYKDIATIHADAQFAQVNVDNEAGKSFNARSIPTIIFYDAQGKEIKRHIGSYANKNAMEKEITEFIAQYTVK